MAAAPLRLELHHRPAGAAGRAPPRSASSPLPSRRAAAWSPVSTSPRSGHRPAPRRRHRRGARHRPRRRHRRRDARRARRRDRQGQRPHLPGPPRRQAEDRVEGADPQPRRPVADLHPGRGPGLPAIAENPEDARRLTIKRNTVAVVTDGSAVLGLGNIGPLAALPVMEGKAALFKRFADIDAFPICLDTQDTDEIVRTVKAIAPVFAGINLEDISAPALLRDRGPAAGGARHPGVPRRPARHRHRRAGRPGATRCGWSARTSDACASS